MNSLLSYPTTCQQPKGRVLLIEPDSSRAAILMDIFDGHGGVDLEVVDDVPNALRSFAEQIPDVLLTSTFLRPSDEASLRARLKELPNAAHVQMIAVPYLVDSDEGATSETPNRHVFDFVRRRITRVRPRWDVQTLPEQVEEYLAHARAIRSDLNGRSAIATASASCRRVSQEPSIQDKQLPPVTAPDADSHVLTLVTRGAENTGSAAADRRRARRRPAGEVPWLWAVKLPGTSHVRVIDISSGGALLETTSRLDETAVEVQLLGQDTDVSVPARPVRNQVASVDHLGVRYRVALMFGRDLNLFGLQPPSGAIMPRDLAGVLIRALSEADRGAGATAVRVRFERELRQLLPVRDIQIRETPMIAERGAESVYFTVPRGSGPQPILQAIFDPGYAPTAMEFRLLKAAASLAAVVLEFAPLGRHPGALRLAGESLIRESNCQPAWRRPGTSSLS